MSVVALRAARRAAAFDGGPLPSRSELAALPDPYAHLRDSDDEEEEEGDEETAADSQGEEAESGDITRGRAGALDSIADVSNEAGAEEVSDESDADGAGEQEGEADSSTEDEQEEHEDEVLDAGSDGTASDSSDAESGSSVSSAERERDSVSSRQPQKPAAAGAWAGGLGLTRAQVVQIEKVDSLTFGQRQALRDALGVKLYRVAIQRWKDGGAALAAAATAGPSKSKGKSVPSGASARSADPPRKKDKNAPMEVSARKKPPRVRQVVKNLGPRPRDPRFDSLAGTFHEDMFDKAYAFLDDKRADERRQVEKEVRRTKNPEDKERLQSLLQSLKDKESHQHTKKERQKSKAERRKALSESSGGGKPKFHLKRSDERRLELLDKFKSLKSAGRLKKALEKRRRNNLTKERSSMPGARGSREE